MQTPLLTGGLFGMRYTASCGHQIDLSWPYHLFAAQAIPVQNFPFNHPGKGLQTSGCGPTSIPCEEPLNTDGPAWSRKHHAPSVRRSRVGKARLIGIPPTSALRTAIRWI
jgi:hypothetical protein